MTSQPAFAHVGGACHFRQGPIPRCRSEAGGFDVGNVGPAFADREIADEALEAADRHRFQRLTDDTHAFALAFLRAHASADRGQEVCGGDDVVGGVVLFDDLLDESGDIDAHRAAGDTFGIGTHEAALRFAQCVLETVAAGDFPKLRPRVCGSCSRIGVRACGIVRIVFFLLSPPCVSSNGSGSTRSLRRCANQAAAACAIFDQRSSALRSSSCSVSVSP